jgi:hypothetical protein
MVQGIETDSKKYKHINRDDEKWLCEDLYVFRKTVEKYIDNLRPNDENEINKSVKKSKKKMMTIDRIIAILFLGIFGSITLITGIYLIIKENYLLGAPLGLFGAVFVVAFYLYEKYR